ncbi:MAG: nucleotidyltransferase domain-containing protein [Deltaproteobacteria bacterium]|nr:nucleotidyltransferase domain-containing protein [Deltaproteobacteria bacterium]
MGSRRLPDDVRGVLLAYRRALDQALGDGVASVRLYGSRARGEARPDSDIDVVVVLRAPTEAERARAIDLAWETWRGAAPDGPPLSPLVWSEEDEADRLSRERRIALDIQQEGIPV